MKKFLSRKKGVPNDGDGKHDEQTAHDDREGSLVLLEIRKKRWVCNAKGKEGKPSDGNDRDAEAKGYFHANRCLRADELRE